MTLLQSSTVIQMFRPSMSMMGQTRSLNWTTATQITNTISVTTITRLSRTSAMTLCQGLTRATSMSEPRQRWCGWRRSTTTPSISQNTLKVIQQISGPTVLQPTSSIWLSWRQVKNSPWVPWVKVTWTLLSRTLVSPSLLVFKTWSSKSRRRIWPRVIWPMFEFTAICQPKVK